MRRDARTFSLAGKIKTVLVALALCLTLGASASLAFAESNATSLPEPIVLDTIVPSKTNIPDALAYGESNTIDLDSVELLEGGSFWQLKEYDNPCLILTTKAVQKGEQNRNAPTAKIKIPNFVTDANGKDLDLILTFDFAKFYTNYRQGSADVKYYPAAFVISPDLMFCSSENDLSDQTTHDSTAASAAGIITQVKMNIDAQLVYTGTATQYTSQYPAAWSYSDLDIWTNWIDSDHVVHSADKPDPSDTTSFNESVYLGTGTQKTYVSKRYNLSNDSTNRWFISKADENSKTDGDDCYDVSGLVAITDAGHFKFTWRGCECGTGVFQTANYHTGIKLTKASSDDSFNQSCAGAVYGVYSDAACKTLVKKITLDANGQGKSADTQDLEKTTYYVKEITAPAGYETDTTVYTCNLSSYSGKWYKLTLKDDPLMYRITTEAINGTIDDSETVYWGEDSTITHAANKGYHLAKVEVDGKEVDISGGYSDSYTFKNIQANHKIKVTNAIDTYHIDTAVENGTIDKGSTANYGDSKTVNYKPNEGYHLAKVEVDGKEVNIDEFTEKYAFANINANHSIKVTYAIDTYRIDTAVENGTIDESCTVDWDGSKTVNYSPKAGHFLVKVIVDGKEVDINKYSNSYTFENIKENHSIKVVYAANAYRIETEVENGSIDDSCIVSAGDSKTVNYKPNEGYHLAKVEVDGQEVSKEEFAKQYVFENIDTGHKIKVTYEINTYRIDTAVENGTIDESCTVDWDGSKTVNYSAQEGYHLAKIEVDGEAVSKEAFENSYAFEKVRENHSIKVVYEINTYKVVTSAEHGTIDEGSTANYGDNKTVNYKPNEGYHLAKVEVDGAEVDIDKFADSYAFENIDADHSINVVYEINTYEVETEVENGTIDESCTVNWSDNKTINYSADEGYHLAKVIVDGKEVDIDKYPESYPFENVRENHSIKVVYEINTYKVVTSAEHGTIDSQDSSCVNEDGTYNWHTSPTITYKADEGYMLQKVEVDGEKVNKDTFLHDYAFENIEADHVINVVYVEAPADYVEPAANSVSGSVLTGDNLILFAAAAAFVTVLAGIVGYIAWKKKSAIKE